MKFEPVQIIFDDSVQKLPEKTVTAISTATKKFLSFLKVDKGFITILFCRADRIRKLNNLYRAKDRSTDILSWEYGEVENEQKLHLPWGELAICPEICKKQAKTAGWNLETELLRLIAHGIAHLKGFDHKTEAEEEEMLQLELELLSLINLRGLYP